MIAIIDYGLGNLGSIANMLKIIGERSQITDDPEVICKADKIILPGVGAFDAGMSNLKQKKLDYVIKNEAKEKKPILGICLGMQLLGQMSEEGVNPGLNLIPFKSVKFNFANVDNEKKQFLKIPHMGWDIVNVKQLCPLVEDIGENQRYYFVHTYHAVCDDPTNILMTCDYGYEFAAAVHKDNVYGVQFHPEKSHDFGMKILENFAKRC